MDIIIGVGDPQISHYIAQAKALMLNEGYRVDISICCGDTLLNTTLHGMSLWTNAHVLFIRGGGETKQNILVLMLLKGWT